MTKARFILRSIDGTAYLSFQGNFESILADTEEIFPLTGDLDPYIGPEMNALLGKGGKALDGDREIGDGA
jgi:hypothetical protein